MEINLLPKIPKTKRYQWPISIIIALIVLPSGVFVGWQTWEMNNTLKIQREILQGIEEERNYYSEQIIINRNNNQLFHNYFEVLNTLNSKHMDWLAVIDGITSKLPSDARINKLAYTGSDNINLNAEFSSIDLTAQYIQWLKTIDWIESVNYVQTEASPINKHLIELEIKLRLQSLAKGGDLK